MIKINDFFDKYLDISNVLEVPFSQSTTLKHQSAATRAISSGPRGTLLVHLNSPQLQLWIPLWETKTTVLHCPIELCSSIFILEIKVMRFQYVFRQKLSLLFRKKSEVIWVYLNGFKRICVDVKYNPRTTL